jgi:hypothetical protein
MNFFDLSLFIAILLAYVLWSVIRVHKKVDMLGQLCTVMLTHLACRPITEIPKEDPETREWESWDKS